MARKSQENPALDMTPMIDVVFELIIFFVVTLTEAQKKDETIELEDGKHGIVLTPDEISRRVKERMRKVKDFPVLIRADYNCRHEVVARVMNAVTAAGIWKISFMAVGEDRTSKPGHPGRPHLFRLKNKN